MSTYILKKDCPFTDNSFGKSKILKQGTEFTFDNVNLYTNSKFYDGYFTKDFVENNPEWFEKKENYPGCRWWLGGKSFVYDPILPDNTVSESVRALFHSLALENNQNPDQLTFREKHYIKDKATHFLKSKPGIFVDAFQIKNIRDCNESKLLLESQFLPEDKQKTFFAKYEFVKENDPILGGFIVSNLGLIRTHAYFSEQEFSGFFEDTKK